MGEVQQPGQYFIWLLIRIVIINSSITNDDIKNSATVKSVTTMTASTALGSNGETKTTKWTADRDYPKAALVITCDGTMYHKHTVKHNSTKLIDNVDGGGYVKIISINSGDTIEAIAVAAANANGT